MDSARKIVVVPAGGLCVVALRDALEVPAAAIKALIGVEICQPRDYRWNGSADVLNVQGIRRLVTLLGLESIEIRVEGETTPAEQPTPPPAAPESSGPRQHHHGDRANGYQPEEG